MPPLLTIPNLLSIQLGSHQARKEDGSCVTLYMLEVNSFYANILCLSFLQIINKWVFSLNMWLYSFCLKLLPCLVLTILTACLIRALYKVTKF